MLKVKKSSWHYRLWKLGRLHASEPKNLCQYFWHLVLIKIALPLLLAGLVLFGIGALLWLIWGHPLEAAIYVFGSVAVAAALLGLLFGGKRLYERREDRLTREKMSLDPPKEPGLVWTMIKARKKQMCPLIQVVDE